jgi:hypothetical protein
MDYLYATEYNHHPAAYNMAGFECVEPSKYKS